MPRTNIHLQQSQNRRETFSRPANRLSGGDITHNDHRIPGGGRTQRVHTHTNEVLDKLMVRW